MAITNQQRSANYPSFETTDAREWAQEFMRLFGHRLNEVDEGLMIAWFANAIETGRSAGEAGT